MGPDSHVDPESRQPLRIWMACYLALAVLGALGIWTLLALRSAVSDLLTRLTEDPLVWGAMDSASFLAMGLTGLLGLVFLEHYLRRGALRGVLPRRITRVFLGELILVFFAYGIQLAILFS